MATFSALKTRLAQLEGRSGTLDTPLDNHYGECINQAMGFIVTDGAHGFVKRWATAETWGTYTLTANVSRTAGSATLTITGENLLSDNVWPGDFIDLNGENYTIVTVANESIGTGVPQRQTGTITAATAKIYRRTLKVPVTGIILGVSRIDAQFGGTVDLQETHRGGRISPHVTGESTHYEVGYSQDKDAAFIRLLPAPTSVERLEIAYGDFPVRLSDASDDLDWPEPTLTAMLLRALEISRMGLRAGQEQTLLAGAARSASINALANAVSGPKRVL